MVDVPHQVLGIASITRLHRACKSFIRKWKHNKKSFIKDCQAQIRANRERFKSKTEINKEPGDDQHQEGTSEAVHGFHSFIWRSICGDRHRDRHQGCFSSSLKTSSLSRKSNGPPPLSSPFRSRSTCRRNEYSIPTTADYVSTPSPSFASRKNTSTPIMFSNSPGMVKASPIEKQLECTLEELCYGCQKKIKITRDVIKITGKMLQEEKEITINVEPGWKIGTKITFEGKENERPGLQAADVTFVISEKRHPLFRREGDDLELVLKIDLIEALTGCTISIPLLDGENMGLTIDDIIHPGYEKIIQGQGMPISSTQNGKRGNLKLSFLVEFPSQLTDNQRSDIVSVLEN